MVEMTVSVTVFLTESTITHSHDVKHSCVWGWIVDMHRCVNECMYTACACMHSSLFVHALNVCMFVFMCIVCVCVLICTVCVCVCACAIFFLTNG